jgi:hypothetical protein
VEQNLVVIKITEQNIPARMLNHCRATAIIILIKTLKKLHLSILNLLEIYAELHMAFEMQFQ